MKICLLLFSIAQYYTVNALFFNESVIHNIYDQKGVYKIIYQIPQIFYSSIISSIINAIIRYFSLSEKNVIELKDSKKDKIHMNKEKNLIKYLNIKFILFFIISFIFLIFFWYYLSCFCSIYKNTQIFIIKDTLMSFGFSLIYPFGIYLLPGILRKASLRNKKKECLYKFSKLLQNI